MLGSWRQQEQELAAIISAVTSQCTLLPPTARCSHFTVDNRRYNSNSRYNTAPRCSRCHDPSATAAGCWWADHRSPQQSRNSTWVSFPYWGTTHSSGPRTTAPQHHSTTTRHRAGLFRPGSKLLCSNIGLGGAAEEDLNNVKICSLRLG